MNKTQKVIVYIDGFNLFFGLKNLGQKYKWLDVQKLAENFIKKDNVLISVKYFTAKLNGNSEQRYRQAIYLDALEKHCKKMSIIEGYFAKARKCNHCHNKTNEEKQTDVNIACEMLVDCYEDKFDVAYLVSGDSDLVMPVKQIISMNKIIIVATPPNRKSQELNKIATNSFNINEKYLEKSQLPSKIPTKRGFLERPTKWQ
jgi:uncharacterized LabA/DUF88 family protein